jgi:hypothetical protein
LFVPAEQVAHHSVVAPATLGVRANGERVVVDLRLAGEESAASWREVVTSLVARHLARPALAVIDGNPRRARARAPFIARHLRGQASLIGSDHTALRPALMSLIRMFKLPIYLGILIAIRYGLRRLGHHFLTLLSRSSCFCQRSRLDEISSFNACRLACDGCVQQRRRITDSAW